MKNLLFTIVIVMFTCSVNAQDIGIKDAEQWIIQNLSQEQVYDKMPEGYELMINDRRRLTFVKDRRIAVSVDHHVIKGLSKVTIQLQPGSPQKLLKEITGMDYELYRELQNGEVEIKAYRGNKTYLYITFQIDPVRNIVIVTISKDMII